ncbi:Replication factor A protein 1 [Entamoeba marina]
MSVLLNGNVSFTLNSNAIGIYAKKNKITFPLTVQILTIDSSKRDPFLIICELSDSVHSIMSIIKCKSKKEVNALKRYSLIEITNGRVKINNKFNAPLIVVEKFQMINSFVNKQIGSNITELSIYTSTIPSRQCITITPLINLSLNLSVPRITLRKECIKFVVKGVVVSKSKKVNSAGNYYFVFIIQDKDGYELKCTCFQDICNRYYDIIKVNNTYYIIDGNLQSLGNQTFKTDKMVNFDCIITSHSTIQQSQVPIQRKSNVKLIKELDNCTFNKLYSIRGVITFIGETYGNLNKRVIEVVDESNWGIKIDFWGDSTQIPNEFKVGQIIQFDNLLLKQFYYSYMTYTMLSNFSIIIGSDKENTFAQALKENNNELPNIQRYSDSIPSSFPIMSLKEFEENVRNSKDKHFKANVIAYIIAFKTSSISYIGCNHCNKIIDNNSIVCPRCNKRCNPQHRYFLKLEIQDSTLKIYGIMLDEVATKFFGKSAKDLIALKERSFDDYQNFFKRKTFVKVRFGLQGKSDDKGVVYTNIFHCRILDEDSN